MSERRGCQSVGRRVVGVAVLFFVSFLSGCAAPGDGDEPYDTLITGGRVVDGTGAPWFMADVGIRDGRIVAVGRLRGHPAADVLDAAGLVVSPGFIDMHAHSDYSVLRDGRGLSKILQGVTTEVIGEGVSVAPRRPDDRAGGYGVEADWTTLREYFDRLERSGVSGNVMSYVSAGQLRRYVMGEGVQRRPTAEELEEMKRLLAQGMEDGAAGLVMALETPGQEQPSDAVPGTEELIELARVVGRYGGVYGTHLRDQGPRIMEAVEEAATIGEQGGVSVEIFHLKAAGRPNFGTMGDALAAIEAARDRGVDIAADVYPYIAAAHGLSTEVPRWVHEGGTEQFLARMADPELRPRIKREVTDYMMTKYYNETTGDEGFDAVIVASVEKNPEAYVGKTIGEIARERGVSPADEVLDLLIEQGGSVGIVMFYMSESDVRMAIAHPLVSFDSDGTAASPEFGGQPHPRWYGSFPRVLGHYSRDEGVLPLEEAVRKMTSHPAQRMGLLDRGILREGMWADVVVFDPDRVIDRATFGDPHRFPDGIDHVMVNGVVVVRNGEHTGAFPGRGVFGKGRRD
ncbi:MAG: D-aminoacylase [Gemmatimonadota bacterium]|nr:D-aminoacylase [Gemmatimonadota bacterium]